MCCRGSGLLVLEDAPVDSQGRPIELAGLMACPQCGLLCDTLTDWRGDVRLLEHETPGMDGHEAGALTDKYREETYWKWSA